MPIFRYKGYKAGGKGIAGTIEADGPHDAALKIRELGLHPAEITEHKHKTEKGFRLRRKAVELAAITRQLGVLVSSGVPLVEAIRALSEESPSHMRGMLVEIRESLQGGVSLSRALSVHEGVFPEFYINMIAAGEESGMLDGVLADLADFLESQDSLKEKIRSAAVYPAFMGAVGLVVLSFLFTFVIPKIVTIFEDTQSALPLATTVLIGVSNFFVNYWWLLLILLPGLFYAIKALRQAYALPIDRIALGMPLKSLYYARLTRTLGFLLAGGLPMLRSLELAGHASGNRWLAKSVHDASILVSEGASLSGSLGLLPPVLLQLIATGEKSGRLPEVLKTAADSYEAEFQRRVQRALALMEPVLILFMGLVVGFVVLAVLLPMFELNQLIR